MASKRGVKRREEKKGRMNELMLLSKKCHSKQAFSTRAEAEDNMERLKAAVYYDGRELNVYVCPLAPADRPHYHFGHMYGDKDTNAQQEGSQCSISG